MPRYKDGIYVLSLPSFTWVKLYQADSGRYGHTCHRVGRQMLTIGGFNMRSNVIGMCDWETASIGVFDLPTKTWGINFNATPDEYRLGQTLIKALGGIPQGRAPRKASVHGWASPELQHIMNTTRIHSDFNGTIEVIAQLPATPPSGLSKSTLTAIIAGVIVFFFILLCCIAWVLYLSKRGCRLSASQEVDSRSSGPPGSVVENEETAKHELHPEPKRIYKLMGPERRHESLDTAIRAELDRTTAVSTISELPPTNFSESGRWGVLTIMMPSPSASREGTAANDLETASIKRRRNSAMGE